MLLKGKTYLYRKMVDNNEQIWKVYCTNIQLYLS